MYIAAFVCLFFHCQQASISFYLQVGMESEGFAIYDTLMQMKCEASYTFFKVVLISLTLVVVRMIGCVM